MATITGRPASRLLLSSRQTWYHSTSPFRPLLLLLLPPGTILPAALPTIRHLSGQPRPKTPAKRAAERSRNRAVQQRQTLTDPTNPRLSMPLPSLVCWPLYWRGRGCTTLGEKLRFAWYQLYNRLSSWTARLMVSVPSRPKWFRSRAKIRFPRAEVVPTAKALYVAMNEALAVGDRDALRDLCGYALYNRLCGQLDARAKGERVEWSLLEYTGGPWYPRKADEKSTMQQANGAIMRHAIVSIQSKQRIAKYDAQDRLIPGSEKEKEVLEHVVIVTTIEPVGVPADDGQDYEQQPWRIWGTMAEASLQDYANVKRMMNAQQTLQAQDFIKKRLG